MSDNPKKEEEEGLEENASRFVELSNLFTQVFKDFYDNQVKLTNEHEILTKDISSLDKICESLSKEITKLNKDVLDGMKELKKMSDTGAKTSTGRFDELGKKLEETNNSSLQALEVNKEELIQNIGILKEFISSNVDPVVTEAKNTKELVQEFAEDVSQRLEKVEKDFAQSIDSLNERVDNGIKNVQETLLEKINENEENSQ